ncbi:hypothetical protein RhiirC2_721398 [Rhizophagus irregularis]|uniref:Uncharacterized protein n=1 Tax=Rhizophagus irregularis TaxID=588596 RepID=A0A2N1M6B3_9GLOM|nr:hypothetical protein RhiirC2_721398 [Rhizophagus irregularis]
MWCFPHISTLLGDLPENATQTLTYSVNSNHPCHKCLISGEDLNNLRLSNNQIELRTPKMMKDILDQQLAHQYSMYNMNNIFWKYPRKEYFLESELVEFKKLITDWATLFVKLFQSYSRSGLKLPKLHNWVYHIINSIEEFGAINGFTTETYEFLHKDYVKIPYRSSNKREAIGQIINTVQIKLTLKHLMCQTKQKKSQKATSLNGLLGKFALENFDEFFDIYKEKNSLASEALLALSCFLTALNNFFDLDDDLNEELITNNTIISWYSYTNMTASEDCI